VHSFTKFFVVLAALLSLMVAALTITYSVNTQRIADQFRDVQRANEQAQIQLRTQAQAHTEEVASLRSELESRDREIAELRSDLNQQTLENQELIARVREAEAEAKAVQGRITQLGVTAETLTSLVENYREEVRTLRDQQLRNRNQRLDLEDRIADLASENQVFEDTIRALREQLAEARRAVQTAAAGNGAGNGQGDRVAAGRIVPGPTIFGRVTDVRQAQADDRTLVEVNLGSNDQITEGTELYAVRGSDYVGTLVVDRVDLQSSVAYVRLTNRDMQVREGDEIRSRILASN